MLIKITRYIQFTCGRGPVEASRSCYLISNKFLKEFSKKCHIEIVDKEEHKNVEGCYMSVMFSLSFDKDEENILEDIENNWKGTLCYKSTANPYRPGHKRKNWFIGCNVINPLELPDISENDITYETMRSGGSGGQNTNKVETCVRAVYKPTGLSVKCSDERSQKQNKERARERLLLKLYEENQNKESEFKNSNWLNHTNLERGNAVQTFTGNLKDVLK